MTKKEASDEGAENCNVAFNIGPEGHDEPIEQTLLRLKLDLVDLNERIDMDRIDAEALDLRRAANIQNLITSFMGETKGADQSKLFVRPDDLKLANLMARLDELEKALNVDGQQLPAPLLNALEDFKIRVKILTPGVLATIHRKLQSSIQTTSSKTPSDLSVESSSTLGKADSSVGAMNELHETVRMWDEKCRDLSNTIEQLVATNSFYSKSEEIASLYSEVISIHDAINRALIHEENSIKLDAKMNSERLQNLRDRIQDIHTGGNS